MADGSPLVRQWTLLKMLGGARNGVTLADMAAEARVHPKTIRRDLQAFATAGFPLEEQPGRHGCKTWRLAIGSDTPDLKFTFDEALALYLGRRFLEPLAGTLLWEAAQSAFKKVRACLGRGALQYLDQMTAHLHTTGIGKTSYIEKATLLDDLLRGIEDRKVVHIEYQSLKATEPVEYELEPYGVIYHKGSLYVVAHSRDHREVRHFKLDRVEKVEVSDFPFPMPANFNINDHLANSFGIYHGKGDVRVKVRFLPPVVRYVQESTWHPSQKLTRQKDGSLLAEFRLSSVTEIKSWILSFGSNAEVIEPHFLRAALFQEAKALNVRYRQANRVRPLRPNRVLASDETNGRIP